MAERIMTLNGAVFGWVARAAESAGDTVPAREGGAAARAGAAPAAAPSAATVTIRAARAAARTRGRPSASFLREEMGDGQEEKENAAEYIHSDHHAPVELRSQRRMSQQIVEPLGQGYEEHDQEDGPPAAKQRDDGDQHDHRDHRRVSDPGREEVHRRPLSSRDGGNVWESNPPRTSETPNKGI